MNRIFILMTVAISVSSCQRKNPLPDASGSFEARETIVSAQTSGILSAFTAQEGTHLKSGAIVGYIDSTQLALKKKQLQAQIEAVLSKSPNIATQLAGLQSQLEHARHEHQRIENLYRSDAATGKQRDDARAQVTLLEKQLAAQRSSLAITSASLQEDTAPIGIQIAQLEDEITKCTLTNPVSGTVLTTYVEPYEMAITGQALYKIANLSQLTLRAYITGNQLANIKLDQQVTVRVDDGQGAFKNYTGIIEWISDEAEFTPKTIQTKEERAHLVYAAKIRVDNDGRLKLGMHGEVLLQNNE